MPTVEMGMLEVTPLTLLLLLVEKPMMPMTTIQRQVTKVKAARSLLDVPSQRWRRARRTKRRKRAAALLMMVLPVDAGEVRLVHHTACGIFGVQSVTV
jgi:hypothetical protein